MKHTRNTLKIAGLPYAYIIISNCVENSVPVHSFGDDHVERKTLLDANIFRRMTDLMFGDDDGTLQLTGMINFAAKFRLIFRHFEK